MKKICVCVWYLAIDLWLEHLSCLTAECFQDNRPIEKASKWLSISSSATFGSVCVCVCVLRMHTVYSTQTFWCVYLCAYASSNTVFLPSAAPMMQLIIKMEVTGLNVIPLLFPINPQVIYCAQVRARCVFVCVNRQRLSIAAWAVICLHVFHCQVWCMLL